MMEMVSASSSGRLFAIILLQMSYVPRILNSSRSKERRLITDDGAVYLEYLLFTGNCHVCILAREDIEIRLSNLPG
jgi:hypothetical protein